MASVAGLLLLLVARRGASAPRAVHATPARVALPPPAAPAAAPGLDVGVEPWRVVRALAGAAALLVVAGVLGEVSRLVFDAGRLHGLVPLFNLDAEANVPAFFSALLLLGCAAVIALIARWRSQAGLPYVRPLRGLALLVAFLGVDEATAIHELLSGPLRSGLGLDGILYYSWVVAYGLGAVLLLAVYAPLLPRLERTTRRLVGLAVALYATGALLMEMVGAGYRDSGIGGDDAVYATLTTVEESLEMAGVLVLLYALLRSLREGCPLVRLRLGAGAPSITGAPVAPPPSGAVYGARAAGAR